MTSSLDRLLQNFQHRFQEFESVKDVFLFVKNPFVVQANGTWCDQAKASFPDVEKAKLQLKLIDLQSDEVLKMRHTETTCETFWTTLVLDFNRVRCCAMRIKSPCWFPIPHPGSVRANVTPPSESPERFGFCAQPGRGQASSEMCDSSCAARGNSLTG
ncbi:UNVERIFIED_CONTAM: hypothetical protein FKN15_032093 [Acipenser sinensis]